MVSLHISFPGRIYIRTTNVFLPLNCLLLFAIIVFSRLYVHSCVAFVFISLVEVMFAPTAFFLLLLVSVSSCFLCCYLNYISCYISVFLYLVRCTGQFAYLSYLLFLFFVFLFFLFMLFIFPYLSLLFMFLYLVIYGIYVSLSFLILLFVSLSCYLCYFHFLIFPYLVSYVSSS